MTEATLTRGIYYFLLLALAVLAVFLMATKFAIGGFRTFIVQSGSMEPTIKTGSLVIVRDQVKPYNIGDIITYGPIGDNQLPTTHRVVDVSVQAGRSLFITQGDANDSPDRRTVSQREIIGKTVLWIPYLGYLVSTAQHPFGFAFLIIVPALFIIADEIKKIYQEFKKRSV